MRKFSRSFEFMLNNSTQIIRLLVGVGGDRVGRQDLEESSDED